jgi:chitodextrinase
MADEQLIEPEDAPVNPLVRSYVIAVRPHHLKDQIKLLSSFTGSGTTSGVLVLQLGGQDNEGPLADVVLPPEPFVPPDPEVPEEEEPEPPAPDPPVANFAAPAGTSGPAPLTVDFRNLSSGQVEEYLWNFGDGGSSTLPNPTHTYTVSGDYTVSLTVTGPGGIDIETKVDFVSVAVPAPVINGLVAEPSSGIVPLEVDFEPQLSGGPVASYLWNFGDGVGTSTDPTPSYVYEDAGDYTVTLTVTGPGGSDNESFANIVMAADPPPPSSDFQQVDTLDRDASEFPVGETVHVMVQLAEGNTDFPAGELGGESTSLVLGQNGQPWVTQWSYCAFHRDEVGGGHSLVELAARITKPSSGPIQLLRADNPTTPAAQPVGLSLPASVAGLSGIRLKAELTPHSRSGYAGSSLDLDLLDEDQFDVDTQVVGPLWTEIEAGGVAPDLGAWRARFRFDNTRPAIAFDWEVINGNVVTPGPDRRFDNLRLEGPTGYQTRIRTTQLDDSFNGSTWRWSQQRGVLFQFSHFQIRATFVGEGVGFSAQNFNDGFGWSQCTGAFSLVNTTSYSNAALLSVPNLQLTPQWQGVAAQFLGSWNSDIVQESVGNGNWFHYGPYKVVWGFDAGFGSGVGITWPGPDWAYSCGQPLHQLLPSLWNWHQGMAVRRRGTLVNDDGTIFNPDGYSVGPTRFMPTNTELLREAGDGNREAWMFLPVGGQDYQGWLNTAGAGNFPLSSDVEAPAYEANFVRNGPADHQHGCRMSAICRFLAFSTNDWLSRRALQARACADVLSYYDGDPASGAFNASLGWALNFAQSNPNQGGPFYRDYAWMLDIACEAYRTLPPSSPLRPTLKRWIENASKLANTTIMANGGLLLDRSGINVQAINFPLFGPDNGPNGADWRGGTKTWSSALSQFALLAAARSVLDDGAVRTATLETAKNLLLSQAMGWYLPLNAPSFSHLTAPALGGGPVFVNRSQRAAAEPPPFYEDDGYYSSPGDANSADDLYWLSGVAAQLSAQALQPGDNQGLWRAFSLLNLWTGQQPATIVDRIQARAFVSSGGPMSGFTLPMIGFAQNLGTALMQQFTAQAPTTLLTNDQSFNALVELLGEAGFSV